jgi:hypothetical protein
VPAWYVERHIVAEGRASFPLERAFDPMILATLCAWRMGKGIYRFDPDLLQELWETPVNGEIPGEILLRMPEWCMYLELPGRALGENMPIQGCFAFVDSEPRFARAELRLIADTTRARFIAGGPNSPWGLDRGGNACCNGRLHGARRCDRCTPDSNGCGREACAGNRQGGRTDRIVVSLSLFRRSRLRRDAP